MDSRYLRIDEPNGYSKEYAKSLLDEQTETSSTADELPNIVVIMDECFSDPTVLGDFSCNEKAICLKHIFWSKERVVKACIIRMSG